MAPHGVPIWQVDARSQHDATAGEIFWQLETCPGQAAQELSEQLSYKLQSSLPNTAPSQITPGKHHLAVTHNAILQVPELIGFLTFLFKKSKNWQQKKTSFSSCQAAKQASAVGW